MISIRRFAPLSLLALVSFSTVACGHNEEEWQAKLKEIEGLNGRIGKISADKKKCDDDLAKAQDDISSIKAELAAISGKAGDLSKLTEEQRQLIERLKKEKESFLLTEQHKSLLASLS